MEKKDFINHYEILGIQPSASDEEIKIAYRTLAKQYHLDSNKDDQQAQDRFLQIQNSYEILNDRLKRLIYDSLLQKEKGQTIRLEAEREASERAAAERAANAARLKAEAARLRNKPQQAQAIQSTSSPPIRTARPSQSGTQSHYKKPHNRQNYPPGHYRIIFAVLCFAASIYFLITFIQASSLNTNNSVTCGNERMQPKDLCSIYDSSGLHYKSYEQMRQDQQTTQQNSPFDLLLTISFVACGAGLMISGIKASKTLNPP